MKTLFHLIFLMELFLLLNVSIKAFDVILPIRLFQITDKIIKRENDLL